MSRHLNLLVAFAALAAVPHCAQAGMPAVLPTDIQLALSMTDSAIERFQAISFFLVVVVICSLVFRAIWNSLRNEFPALPLLSFWRSLGLIFLWGVAMIVVLTMISGARELMTPGAWEKKGFTYRVAHDAKPESGLEDRLARLAELRTALLRYAALHEGHYPDELAALNGQALDLPHMPGLRYRYVPALTARDGAKVLVYEPDVERERRLALLADGEIRVCTSAELGKLLAEGGTP